MPTPNTAKWPKPRSADEFEDIAVDFVRLRWKDPHATRNGRNGQNQAGVDIVGAPAWLGGRLAGAQCKNTENLTLKKIADAVDEAKAFVGGLGELLLLTTADRDAGLQAQIREHLRSQPAPFHVEIIFWPDIVTELAGDDALVAKHWKWFTAPAGLVDERLRPHWIDREAVRDDETAESHVEIMLSIPIPGVDIDAAELSRELLECAGGSRAAFPFVSTVAKRPVRVIDGRHRRPLRQREYANVVRAWELDVIDRGSLIFRWSKFASGQQCLFEPLLLVTCGSELLQLHRRALEQAVQRLNIARPVQVAIRIAAHASGQMLVHDEARVTEITYAARESGPDWTTHLQADWNSPLLPLVARLANRALSNFGQGASGVAPLIDEAKLVTIVGASR